MRRTAPIAAFVCERCPSDTADPTFIKDELGYLVMTLLTCVVCGWVDQA